ncbi:hypothetical protein ACIP6X_30580 [Streptomyces coeruleorubidus]|uniref:hypothetical protein n=1 Tax=Streptomyces coeruleorubidus TaxID=116188 RepID=UPI0037F5BF3C
MRPGTGGIHEPFTKTRPGGRRRGGGPVTVLTAPAQAAPEADEPVGTVRLVTEKRVTVDYPWAGASGFQYRPGTSSVTTVDYPDAVPPAHAGPDDLASGTDVVNTRDGRTVTQRHRSTGVTATVTIPSGHTYRAAAGWSVLTMDGTGALHVLRTVEGTLAVDTPVTGFPAGARPVLYRTGGSVGRLAIVYVLDGKTSVGLVDLADGAFRTYVTSDESTPQFAFNDRWLVADWRAIRVDAEPGTEPTALTRTDAQPEAVVGDQLLLGNPAFVQGGTEAALTARSLVTGASSTVLTSSFGGIGPTLDGGALATAGRSSLDWNIHRITLTGSGGLTTTKVARVPAAATGVQGLAVAGGELFLQGATPGASLRYNSFQLDADGRPTGAQTPRSPALSGTTCLPGDAACPQLEALGDGRVGYLWTNSAGQESVLNVGLDTSTILSEPTDGDSGGRLAGGTGRYVLYNGSRQAAARGLPARRDRRRDHPHPRPHRGRRLGPDAVDPGQHPGLGLRPQPQGRDDHHPRHRRLVHPHRHPGRQHLAVLDLRRHRGRLRPRHQPEDHGPGRPRPGPPRRRLPAP